MTLALFSCRDHLQLISRVPEIIAELPGKVDGALEDAANEIAEGAKERARR